MIKESISTQLIRWVFFWYCIVAISVTGIQVFAEYQDTQKNILNELSSYEQIFNKVLANAMWNLDRDGLSVILNSMVSVPVIEGVKITREEDIFLARGRIISAGSARYFDKQHKSYVDFNNDTIFSHQYTIQFDYAGSELALGTVTLYSSSAVILNRVKTGFIFILVNAVVKTIALWMIFLFFCRRILINPLKMLSEKVRNINFENLQSINLTHDDSQSQEIYQLNLAFVEMAHKLNQAKNTVENFNSKLEHKVIERTEELEAEKDRALKAENIKSEFLAVISHEIRTPLNGMVGMLDVLEKDNLNDKQTRQLLIAKRSANDLLQLMNDILDISQIESNELILVEQSVNLPKAIDEILCAHAHLWEEKGLEFYSDIRVSDKNVLIDGHRFQQIIHNLLSNACKFTLSGRIEFHCHEAVSSEANHIFLNCKVVDTGVGISKENVGKLYQLFTQLDSSHTRKFGGSGLGLSIVKKLCEAMGGRIWVESKEGQGSTFSFEIQLPLDSNTKLIESPEKQLAPLSGHVLLVEDNLINQEVMKDMLADLNISCDIANNGQEGFGLIQTDQPYSLVIMDCQMPVMDGYECTLNIRKWEHDQGLPHLPIVALTANTQQSDLQKCLDVGMDRALTKPIEMQTLQQILTEYLVV